MIRIELTRRKDLRLCYSYKSWWVFLMCKLGLKKAPFYHKHVKVNYWKAYYRHESAVYAESLLKLIYLILIDLIPTRIRMCKPIFFSTY